MPTDDTESAESLTAKNRLANIRVDDEDLLPVRLNSATTQWQRMRVQRPQSGEAVAAPTKADLRGPKMAVFVDTNKPRNAAAQPKNPPKRVRTTARATTAKTGTGMSKIPMRQSKSAVTRTTTATKTAGMSKIPMRQSKSATVRPTTTKTGAGTSKIPILQSKSATTRKDPKLAKQAARQKGPRAPLRTEQEQQRRLLPSPIIPIPMTYLDDENDGDAEEVQTYQNLGQNIVNLPLEQRVLIWDILSSSSSSIPYHASHLLVPYITTFQTTALRAMHKYFFRTPRSRPQGFFLARSFPRPGALDVVVDRFDPGRWATMLLGEEEDVNAGGGGGSGGDNIGWKQAWGLVKPTFVTSGDAIVQTTPSWIKSPTIEETLARLTQLVVTCQEDETERLLAFTCHLLIPNTTLRIKPIEFPAEKFAWIGDWNRGHHGTLKDGLGLLLCDSRSHSVTAVPATTVNLRLGFNAAAGGSSIVGMWIRHDPRVSTDWLVHLAALTYAHGVRRIEGERCLIAVVTQKDGEEGACPGPPVEIYTAAHDLDTRILERGSSVAVIRFERSAFLQEAPEVRVFGRPEAQETQETFAHPKVKSVGRPETRSFAPSEMPSFGGMGRLEQSGWLDYDRHLQLPPSLFQIPSQRSDTVPERDVRSYYSMLATHKPSTTQPNPTNTAAFRPTTASVGTNTTYLNPNERPRGLTLGGHRDAGPAWDASPIRRPGPTTVPNRFGPTHRPFFGTPPLRTEDLEATVSLATRDLDPRRDETMWTAPAGGVTYRPLFEMAAVPSPRIEDTRREEVRSDEMLEQDEETAHVSVLLQRVSEALTPERVSIYDERSVAEGQEIIARLVDDPEKTFLFWGEREERQGVWAGREAPSGRQQRWGVGETVNEGPTLARITAKYMPSGATRRNTVEGTTLGTDGYSYATLDYLKKFGLIGRGS
ncbi:hypothetical protein BC937DRAFT_87002 [Endogone sp. FLAS-F59071]|nr:hypothetical protein BC937DRAFT_87002 [Endogone sp. FLAS-F59071]|eukprot:RUS19751.1 hypothetical protein BC937DRAFT_87002 [Endogone sp. FLAS-F59071]